MTLTGYKRVEYTCSKCNEKIIVESDYLTDAQAKSIHKCRKVKSEKGK